MSEERGGAAGGGGRGEGGIEHVFEVAPLIPIQMSESTWTGEEGAERLLEGREGREAD